MASSSNEVPKPGSFMNTAEHINFNNPNSFHDRVLVVEDKKFYVQSGVLSLSSVYFRALFGPNFAEANQREIPLPDVSATAFTYFLQIVYPGHFSEEGFLLPHVIDPAVLLELVSLSFRFLCPIVLSEAKKIIIRYCLTYGVREFDLVNFINLFLLHDLEDLKEVIIEALRNPEFVSDKNEEIMNAPEHVKNFALAALMEEKIQTARRDNNSPPRHFRRSRSRSSSEATFRSPRTSGSESPPVRRVYVRDQSGSPPRRVYRRRY